jgi:probable phosphoglycerate mutase
MRNIYVITHPESVHHIQGLAGGWYDDSLTENGRGQARKIAIALRNEIGEQDISIYSSDLKRCVETADAFAEVFGTKVSLDRGLREASWGEADGKTREWWKHNVVHKAIDGNQLDHQMFRNSESRREVGTRIQRSLARIVNTLENRAIIITLGFALTFVIMTWLKVPVENMDYCHFQPHSGGVTLLQEDDLFGSRSVAFVNNLDYLTS